MEELGSHHMFLAEVTAVQVDDSYMDDNGKFMLNNTGLIAYSHGNIYLWERSLVNSDIV